MSGHRQLGSTVLGLSPFSILALRELGILCRGLSVRQGVQWVHIGSAHITASEKWASLSLEEGRTPQWISYLT